MQCPNCGNTLPANAAFCNNCGQRMARPAAETQYAGETIAAPPGGGPPSGGFPGAGPGSSLPPQGQTYVAPPPSSGSYGGPPPSSGSYGGPGAGGPPPYAGGQSAPAGPPPGYGAGPAGPSPYGPGGYGPGAGMGARPRGAQVGSVNFAATLSRLGRLAKYDTSIFREAAQDATALIPGLVVAAVSFLVLGLGTWLWAEFKFDAGFDSGEFFWKSVLVGTVIATAAWAGWVAIAGLLLQQMFRRQVSIPNLLGAMGLATIPAMLGLLAVIDFLYLTFAIVPLVGVGMLSQSALQEATDASPGEAFVANLIGFLIFALVLLLLGREDNNLAPGIFGVNLWSSL